jgi:hypothetical protein
MEKLAALEKVPVRGVAGWSGAGRFGWLRVPSFVEEQQLEGSLGAGVWKP